jgi:hypothetical protein
VASWWGSKVRQVRRHLTGRVSPAERAALEVWLNPAQLELFETMHRADQRHGLDVVEALRVAGHDDPDLRLAGLLHDASKGRSAGLGHRIAYSLGERYGPRIWSLAGRLPGYGDALERLRRHPDESARLALAAGCSPVTAELIRHQASPRDPLAGEALRLADEAS